MMIKSISFIAFGFHTKINYPKSIGDLDPRDTTSGTLEVLFIQAGGTGLCSDCTSPWPWVLAPQQPPAGKRPRLQAQQVSADPFARLLVRHCVGRVRGLRPGWCFSRQGRSLMSSALWLFILGTLSQGILTFWDHSPQSLSHSCPVVICVLHLCCCCPLDLGGARHGGAREEETQCCWGASNPLHTLSGWIYAQVVKRGPANTVEQWSQTSALLFLACSLLLFQTDLMPSQPLLHSKLQVRLRDTSWDPEM